jgi:ABC-type transport system involved in multi-copper enzyme maturation permease subunit
MIHWLRVVYPLYVVAWWKRLSLDAGRVLGPIFQIEAMLTVRRARYYFLRAAYGFVLLFIMWTCYQSAHETGLGTLTLQSTARFATSFFYSFAAAQLTIAIAVTAAVTAGTIAEERERRTIEYLFATDLSNAEIVLGKLASRVLLVLVFLLAGLPVLSLALLFGGIDPGNLLQLFVVTASTVVASASFSMLVSVWAKRPRDAVVRAFILLMGLIVLPWLALFLSLLRPVVYQWLRSGIEPLVISNPFVFLVIMANIPFPVPAAPQEGWPGVAELSRNHALLSIFMLVLAIWRLRRVHLRETVQRVRKVMTAGMGRLLRPPLGKFPMVWKELFAEQAVSGMGLFSRLFVALLFLAMLAPLVRQFWRCMTGVYRLDDFQSLVGALTTVVGSLLLFVLSARAATSVTSEKERQSWDTLLSTPLSAWEIVLGKTLGNVFALRWVLGLMAVMWAMVIVLRPRAVGMALTMACTIAALCPLFVGMGLYFSLRCRSSTRAMCWSVLLTLFVGGGYLFFAAPLGSMLVRTRVIRPRQADSVMAGCAPYLIAWSGNREMRRPPDGIGTLPFLLSVAGYFIVGAGIFVHNVRAFDRLSGRPNRRRAYLPAVGEYRRAAEFSGECPSRLPISAHLNPNSTALTMSGEGQA